MTPFAKQIMRTVRQKDHKTYERWFQAIVDTTLEQTAEQLDLVMMEILHQRSNAAVLVRSLKSPEPEPCE